LNRSSLPEPTEAPELRRTTMIQVTPREIDIARHRYDAMLAAAARARLVVEATQPPTSAKTQTAGRIRPVLRQAVASLVMLVSIG
jgi:hypothetical protein